MYRSCAWCPRLCYYIDTCGGIDFLQYWTIQCRIQVSYMYQMYCESLGGNSVVSQLALMSARCLGRRDLPTLLAYYPYYCILPLPPTPTSYYPYYPYLLPLLGVCAPVGGGGRGRTVPTLAPRCAATSDVKAHITRWHLGRDALREYRSAGCEWVV